MEKPRKVSREERRSSKKLAQDGILVRLDGSPLGQLIPDAFNKHKIVFPNSSQLVPIVDDDWKVILNTGEEIMLPYYGGWIITFSEDEDYIITNLPYERIAGHEGEWIILNHWNKKHGLAWVYCGCNEPLVRRWMKDVNEEWWRKKQLKRQLKANKKAKQRREDDEDDEEKIMRALGNGNGDLYGF